MSWEYNEDNLVEQATVDILENLGWYTDTAWHNEIFGESGTLGRENKSEVILKKYLLPMLEKLNPGLPKRTYQDAYLKIKEESSDQNIGRINKEKYELFKSGIKISYTNEKGELSKKYLKIFDFNNPENNHFLAVRQLEVVGVLYSRRPDVIGFVNGIPLVFFELKAHHRDLRHAYSDNLKDYKDTIPHLFYSNAFVVLSNGIDTQSNCGTKIGTITSPYKFFHEWKRIDENTEGVVSLETTLKGTCSKENLVDLFENFLLFDDSSGEVVKILAKNHQYLGVNKAINQMSESASKAELQSKLGVFWHTQGSGKSYSMVFLSQKIHRKLIGSYTILIVVDRSELESQIYETFTAVGAIAQENVLAESRDDLRRLLKENHRYVFTLIHKFSIDASKESEYPLLSERDDIIVISDEAHRTQGGVFARNMRFNALPNASYIGFTGTPIIKGEEELTKNIFGEYVSVYNFKSAIEDGATLPLMYINKGDKLELNNPTLDNEIVDVIENEDLDDDQRQKLQRVLKSNYPILTSEKRLRSIAKDLTWHFNDRGYQGKGMFVALDKPTAVRMYDYISEYWKEYLSELEERINQCKDEQESLELESKYSKVKNTEICVVVSAEQNEVDKFKKLGLDITPHRKKFVERDLEKEFKDPDNPFRLAIVCAMWITGFDAPSVSTVYLDKPIKGHTLMQTIARANRVFDDEKENGLIVDYGNVYKQLEEAYSVYGESTGHNSGGDNQPTQSIDELTNELELSIRSIESYFFELDFDLNSLLSSSPLERLGLITQAINSVCTNDETRANFEVMTRDVFKKYKALFPEEQIKKYTSKYNAIEAIYSGLNQKVRGSDITEILQELNDLVGESIEINENDNDEVFIDLSNLDFDKLKELFKKKEINKAIYDLKDAVAKKLQKIMSQNPLRFEFYEKYLEIIESYNNGKDAETIKKAFEELVNFINEMSEEEHRAVKENLDEETLAIFDLLRKDSLSKTQVKEVKKVAVKTLEKLKDEKLNIERWRESTQISAQIKTTIHDNLLWLPEDAYEDSEVEDKTLVVYQHIYSNYYGGGQSIYNTFAA